MRVAYQFLPLDGARRALGAVAGGRKPATNAAPAHAGCHRRAAAQFAIIPIAVILVWVGLSRGIAPLNPAQSLIRRGARPICRPSRRRGFRREVRPLIIAFNDMMARLEENLQAQQHGIADAAHQMRLR